MLRGAGGVGGERTLRGGPDLRSRPVAIEPPRNRLKPTAVVLTWCMVVVVVEEERRWWRRWKWRSRRWWRRRCMRCG